MAYIIAIKENNLPGYQQMPNLMLLIPPKYANLPHVFLKDAANTLLEYRNHGLQLETTGIPLFEPFYNLFQNKLKVFQEYITDNLAKEFIQPSYLSAGAFVLFVKKRDGNLHLCVNYKGLNLIIKKNYYSLLLVSETLDWVVGAKIFTKLDICATYNWIRVWEKDE